MKYLELHPSHIKKYWSEFKVFPPMNTTTMNFLWKCTTTETFVHYCPGGITKNITDPWHIVNNIGKQHQQHYTFNENSSHSLFIDNLSFFWNKISTFTRLISCNPMVKIQFNWQVSFQRFNQTTNFIII